MLVVERLSRPDAVDLLPRESGPDVAALRDRASALRVRLEQIAVEFAADLTVTPAMVRTMTARTREELARAEAELAAAGRTSVLAPLVTGDDVEAVADMETAVRRQVIAALMAITLHPTGRGARRFDPATIEIEWL